MLVFKHLEYAIKKVYAQKKQESDPAVVENLERKLKSLLEISDYVKNGNWLVRESAEERLMYCLTHTLDESASHFNCTKASISSSLTKYSRKFEEIIGKNTIQMILEDKIEEAMLQFYMGTGKVSNLKHLIVEEVFSGLPKAKYNPDINLTDCINEFRYLRISSKAYFKSLQKRINPDKLAMIRYIFEVSDAEYAEQRVLLFNMLNDEQGDINSVIEKLKGET